MARNSWWLVICVSVGLAALVLAWLPSAWPNPLADERLDPQQALTRLQPAAAAVDAACRAGDRGAFAEATTAGYREDLEARLQVVDGVLDSATLQGMSRASSCEQWLRQPVLAVLVDGEYAAVAVRREQGDGAQVLSFRWDGEQFRLSGMRHAPRVASESAAQRYLRELLRQMGL